MTPPRRKRVLEEEVKAMEQATAEAKPEATESKPKPKPQFYRVKLTLKVSSTIPEIDKIIARARQLPELQRRINKLAEAQKELLQLAENTFPDYRLSEVKKAMEKTMSELQYERNNIIDRLVYWGAVEDVEVEEEW